MASNSQRIFAVGFLAASIGFGMSLARGQVNPGGPPPVNNNNGNLPVGAGYGNGGNQQAPQFIPAPPQPGIVNSSNGSGSRSSNRANQNVQAMPTPEPKFVPSEVEAFVSSTMKHGEPHAVLHTSLGDITLRLLITKAPRTVKNFMDLARGDREFIDSKSSKKVRRPFYNNLTFHKVVDGEYIQTGCPFGNGRGGPGYTLPDEIGKDLNFEKAGMVAMAPAREGIKFDKDSNGSQFFITLGPQPTWTGEYTIFAEVEKGMRTLQKLSLAMSGPTDRPIRRLYLNSVDIIDEESARVPAPALPMPTHGPASADPAMAPSARPSAPSVGTGTSGSAGDMAVPGAPPSMPAPPAPPPAK